MARRWPLLFGLVVGLVAMSVGLGAGGDRIEGWDLAARWTARAGFPLFILVYSASSLGRLMPANWTRSLWRNRRWWGLGFAASHTIHLAALTTYLEVGGKPRPLPLILGGGVAYALLYAMALTSNDASMRVLGRNWKRLHTIGIHWLWFVFLFAYLGRTVRGVEMPYAGAALAVALAALGLRIAAWRKMRRG